MRELGQHDVTGYQCLYAEQYGAGIVQRTFPHRDSSPRKVFYIENLPPGTFSMQRTFPPERFLYRELSPTERLLYRKSSPRGKVLYIENLPPSQQTFPPNPEPYSDFVISFQVYVQHLNPLHGKKDVVFYFNIILNVIEYF